MGEGFRGRSFFSPLGLLAAAILVHSTCVFAQRPPTVPINLNYFRIEFIQPGARPAGLGGAFIGAAQDETAAAINPAGLIYLKSAGASLHQRKARLRFKEPEGTPESESLDSTHNFHISNFDQSLVTVFLPVKKITLAIFRQVAFDARYNFETRQFLTTNSNTPRFVLGGLGNFPGRKVDLDLEMVHDAFSIGYAISKRLSIGAAAKNSVLNFKLNEQLFLDSQVENGQAPRPNGAASAYSITTVDDRETERGFTLGLMAKLIVDKLFVGAVWNLNPTFNLDSEVFLPEYKLTNETFSAESTKDNPFKLSVPDSYGFGLYYVANHRLRLTFDVVRIEYSDLLSGNDLNVVADDQPNAQGVFEDPDGQDDLTLDDVIEIHAGTEWLFKVPKLGLMPLRFGVFTSPGHRIYPVLLNPDLRRLFPEGKDRVHFTFGLGVVLTSNVKFDGSIIVSPDGFEISGSTLLNIPL